jgi:hypothetical protein
LKGGTKAMMTKSKGKRGPSNASNDGVSTAAAVGVEDDDGFVAATMRPRGKSGDKISTNAADNGIEVREGEDFLSFMKREVGDKMNNPAWRKQIVEETLREMTDEERNELCGADNDNDIFRKVEATMFSNPAWKIQMLKEVLSDVGMVVEEEGNEKLEANDDGVKLGQEGCGRRQKEDDMTLERDVKLMRISDIKAELESLGVSTRTFLEKDELIYELIRCRKVSKLLVKKPEWLTNLNPEGLQQQYDNGINPTDQILKLLNDLTIGNVDNLGCLHGADHDIGRLTLPLVNIFIAEFQMKLRIAVGEMLNKVVSDGFCDFNSRTMWDEIMPSNVHPDYKDKSACDMLVACLVCIGTNYICTLPPCFHSYYASFIAQTILFIEAMSTGTPEVVHGLEYNSKLRDMWDDKKRIVTFFHKRNGCSCLKEIYIQQKAQPKMSICYHCQKHFERKKIMLCTQCKFVQYCSTECQRANWPNHREWCKQRHAEQMRVSQLSFTSFLDELSLTYLIVSNKHKVQKITMLDEKMKLLQDQISQEKSSIAQLQMNTMLKEKMKLLQDQISQKNSTVHGFNHE